MTNANLVPIPDDLYHGCGPIVALYRNGKIVKLAYAGEGGPSRIRAAAKAGDAILVGGASCYELFEPKSFDPSDKDGISAAWRDLFRRRRWR